MPKLAINLIRYNQDAETIINCVKHILAQDYDDFQLTFSENASSAPIFEELRKHFLEGSKFRIVDNGSNLGYAGGHNKFFKETDSEFVMPINPDALLQDHFFKNITKAFEDSRVASATGKMLKPELDAQGNHIIDGTGLIVYKSRRARERGQLEIDRGQFDKQTDIFGVSGSAAVYRKSALEKARLFDHEYFDEDFFMYWEDFDLAWRLRLLGYSAKYVPEAVVFHSRVAGQSKGGYKNLPAYIAHHNKLSLNIRRWNWRNHLFAVIKNDFGWNYWKATPYFFFRELTMLAYICVLEPRTLGALPTFFKLLPRMLKKRKIIQMRKQISSKSIERWFI